MLDQAAAALGSIEMMHHGPFIAGQHTTVRFVYTAGTDGLPNGAMLRVGIPNTGWEQPVPPQQRYWDELVQGSDRRLAPFHPVNTTVSVKSANGANAVLTVMERMLVPDEDPAFAYWRWWITATIEGSNLLQGDTVEIVYGDTALGIEGVRIQTFPEPHINVTAYIKPDATGEFMALGEPIFLDVVAGPASQLNVVAPSVTDSAVVTFRASLMDGSQNLPGDSSPVSLSLRGEAIDFLPGKANSFTSNVSDLAIVEFLRNGEAWGKPNPVVPLAEDGLRLFWGDLHAQSEHHVMHSQKKDFRQQSWSKGISCGTLDECYQYGQEVSMLDFVAMTDQGACLTDAWEYCQGKVREYHQPGRFVVFKAYEAGAPSGHRNVIYSSDEIEAPLDRVKFNMFHPPVLYDYYRDRGDAIMIPHHVKTWTDWQYHDPILEPVMEIYSCWGQSENPSRDLWNKGTTPGAGAWNAYKRGYKMGMMASSDNHVGMPGRSAAGDRQAHTPFKGGLCAIWSPELERPSLFEALRQRSCYGTTGARIVVRFSIDGNRMGSSIRTGHDQLPAQIEIAGTDALRSVEVVSSDDTVRRIRLDRNVDHINEAIELPVIPGGFHYLRIAQVDNERAWTSPIFFEA